MYMNKNCKVLIVMQGKAVRPKYIYLAICNTPRAVH